MFKFLTLRAYSADLSYTTPPLADPSYPAYPADSADSADPADSADHAYPR